MTGRDTPVRVESDLRVIIDQMDAVRIDLRKIRDAEVQAEQAYKAALRRVLLSGECPKVGSRRGDGSRVTVAERDAWAADNVSGEELAWQLAKAKRQAAKDHLTTLGDQMRAVQSIGASVRQDYQAAGRFGP